MSEPTRRDARLPADESYWQRRQLIQAQLRQISEALNKHGDRQSRHRSDWGFAGDVGHVSCALQEILDFLHGNQEPPEEPYMGHDGRPPKPEIRARAKARIGGFS